MGPLGIKIIGVYFRKDPIRIVGHAELHCYVGKSEPDRMI